MLLPMFAAPEPEAMVMPEEPIVNPACSGDPVLKSMIEVVLVLLMVMPPTVQDIVTPVPLLRRASIAELPVKFAVALRLLGAPFGDQTLPLVQLPSNGPVHVETPALAAPVPIRKSVIPTVNAITMERIVDCGMRDDGVRIIFFIGLHFLNEVSGAKRGKQSRHVTDVSDINIL
jgi:hypothetical protein